MLLCKIMLNLPDDVAALVAGKMATKYAGRDVGAMKAVAAAHEKRDLGAFEAALRDFKAGEFLHLARRERERERSKLIFVPLQSCPTTPSFAITWQRYTIRCSSRTCCAS